MVDEFLDVKEFPDLPEDWKYISSPRNSECWSVLCPNGHESYIEATNFHVTRVYCTVCGEMITFEENK